MPRPTYHASDRRTGQRIKIDWPTVLAQNDRWLRTVAAWRLRDRHAVDEVMQEVALAAVRQAAPLNDPGKVAPWLYRLTVRHVLLYRRQRGRAQRLLARYEARGDWGRARMDCADPLSWLLADERQQLVRAALERLPRRDAEILLLKYTEDWTYQQIAEHLGVGHSAVESRLHRARARLRSELAVLRLAEVEP